MKYFKILNISFCLYRIKKIFFFILFLISNLIIAQTQIEKEFNLFNKISTSEKFELSKYSKKITDKEKLKKFIELMSIKDISESKLGERQFPYEHFLRIKIDSLTDVIRDSLLLFPNVGIKEILEDFYAIDINNDGNLDYIYNSFIKDYGYQNLVFFINNGKRFTRYSYGGYMSFAKFENNKLAKISIYISSCAINHCHIYLDYDIQIDSHYKLVLKMTNFTATANSVLKPQSFSLLKDFSIKNKARILSLNKIVDEYVDNHCRSGIFYFQKDTRGQTLAKINFENRDYYFVKISITEKIAKQIDIKMLKKIKTFYGWLPEDEIILKN